MVGKKQEEKVKRLRSVPKIAWSLDEIAAATSLSYAGLRREINAGRLVIKKVGRRTIVLNDDFQAWLALSSYPQAS